MILYANELVDEIRKQKPSDATMVVVDGHEIKDVGYKGNKLYISLDESNDDSNYLSEY